jgi:hypothetical protein
MTAPDRGARLWLVLAVATRYTLALGGAADEAEFATATATAAVDVPASTGCGTARSRRRSASPAVTATRQPRRRRSGTKERLVSVLNQGLAVLMSVLMAGHALPKPSWKPEPWLELRCETPATSQQPPPPIPKNPSQ